MIALYKYIGEMTLPYAEAVKREISEAAKNGEEIYTLYHCGYSWKALAVIHMGNIYNSALEIPNIGNSADVSGWIFPYLYSYFSGEF